jgi:hypothetical protein
VLASVFDPRVRFAAGRGVRGVPGVPRACTGSDRAGMLLLPRPVGCPCWSGGCGQDGEALPGFTLRTIHRSPSGQFSVLDSRPVISAVSLSSSMLPSWQVPGFNAPAGTLPMASSSAPVIIHPVVNSTVFRLEFRDSRCLTRSWLAPAPSTRARILRRNRDGTCFSASASTSLWSVNVFDPAFPGRSFMARHSRVLAHQAPSGWKP